MVSSRTASAHRAITCYVTGAADLELAGLREALSDLCITTHWAHNVDTSILRPEDAIRRIHSADFVIAIVGTQPSANVCYELGICDGLGKPVFVLVSDEIHELPFFLSGRLFLKAKFKETDVLGLHFLDLSQIS